MQINRHVYIFVKNELRKIFEKEGIEEINTIIRIDLGGFPLNVVVPLAPEESLTICLIAHKMSVFDASKLIIT